MTTEWMTILLTSALRLVVISALFVANAGALWHVASRRSRNHERFSIITILFLNILYLLIIWAPFTITAFRQDLLNLQEARDKYESTLSSMKEADASEFIVEYIDLRTGKVIIERPDLHHREPRAVQEKNDADFNILPSLRIHLPKAPKNDSSQPAKHPVTVWSVPSSTELRKTHSNWNTGIQDLETSSCAYSLALTGVVRMVITRRPALLPTQPLSIMIGSLILVVVPAIITGLTRIIGGTTAHFALHEPEISDSGYAIYNIICDVHITEAYVLSLFLEWVVLFTLAVVALGVGFGFRTKKDKTYSEEITKEKANGSVETWARDFVLVLGAIWAWPVKPLFVLILYCQFGAHWTNVVCWLANAVVAIPVVFMPQAVFLSRFQKKVEPPSFNAVITDRDIITSEEAIDAREERDGSEEDAKAKDENKSGADNSDCITTDKVCTNFMADKYGQGNDTMLMSTQVTQEEKNYAQANLKFYLGTDILKHGKISTSTDNDDCITLKSEWNPNSEV